MTRTWTPFLLLSVVYLLSYTSPFTYRSAPSPDSEWALYSAAGQLGWVSAELNGPDPQTVHSTTASQTLDELLEHPGNPWGYSFWFASKAETQVPGAELDGVQRRSFSISWLLLVLACFLTACWNSWRNRQSRSATDNPT